MWGLLGLLGMALLSGCGRAPSPLAPALSGSIGMPHRGVLHGGVELRPRGEGFSWLRNDDRHFATPRFVAAIERAAHAVARQRPGSTLLVGDLSRERGGRLLPHLSHRSGRDADLLLYLVTLDGEPVVSPGFVHVGADGLAWDAEGKRWLRLDVERQWLLVKAFVEDPDARVQWMFVSRNVEALLLEWARARGEPAETIVRAMDVMLQPAPPAQAHDDHVHVRTACAAEEIASGCEPTGPKRAWLEAPFAPARAPLPEQPASVPSAPAEDTTELVLALLAPASPVRADAPGPGALTSGSANR